MIKNVVLILVIAPLFVGAQDHMTPELLWKLGRVAGLGISKDGKYVVYSVATPDADANKSSRKSYRVPLGGGAPVEISNPDSLLFNRNVSPDGKYLVSSKEVKV